MSQRMQKTTETPLGEGHQTPAQLDAVPAQQRYHLAAATLVLLTALATLLAYPHLPNVIPLHGEVNAFGPKWSLFLYTPGLMIAIVLMFVALPWLSPRRFQANSLRPGHLYFMLVVTSLLSYSQVLVLLSGLGINVEIRRALEGGICLLIALLAKTIGKFFQLRFGASRNS
jgi:uncharacterized membrane protein